MWFQKPPLGTPLDWGNPLNDETVLHLAMNEGHGDKVQDISLNGNHGTLKNFAFPPTAASGWNPGQTGIGLNFDGVDDNINCGNGHDFGSAITVSAMINTTVTGNQILSKHSATGPFYLQAGGDTSLRFMTYTSVGRVNHDATVIYKGDWHNVVGTYDSSIGKSKMYVDGNMIGAPAAQSGLLKVTTANVFVGTYGAGVGVGGFFDGGIDQARIQSRAWTAKEVRDYSMNPWQVYLDEDD